MASTAEKLDLELWEEAKADARAAYGGHSARAMQYASKLYKARGGRYKGRKRADNRLVQWTRQDWTTKSGRPSRETGERYLPRAAIESLSPQEYGASTRAKRAGGGVGSVVAQPPSIREKTRKFRKVNPDMATAKQIAARKRFAEMARSGELARMRKKATRKSNPNKTETKALQIAKRNFDAAIDQAAEYKSLAEALDIYRDNVADTLQEEGVTDSFIIRKALNQYDRMADTQKAIATKSRRKRNPAKTVSEEISRQVRKGRPQKQAVAIALEMERAGKLKKNPARKYYSLVAMFDFGAGYGVQFGDYDRETVKFEKMELDREEAGQNPMYDSKIIVTSDDQKSINEAVAKLNQAIEPQRKMYRKLKRNPTATRAPARPRTKLISNGREKNPVKPKEMTVYQVQYRRPNMKLFEEWTTVMYLPLAKDIAHRLADDLIAKNWTIKVESIKVKS